MVAHWIQPTVGNRIDDDEKVRLNTGHEVNLCDIPNGPNWNQDRLDKLSAAIQAKIDNVIPLSSLSDDDPDKDPRTNLKVIYGNRVFLDNKGNIVYRSTLITFTHDGTRLVPRCDTVR